MTTAPTIVRRDYRRNGQTYHNYLLDGVKAWGVTSTLSAAVAKGGLVPWAAKASAQEVLDRWDELAAMVPSDRYELVRTAHERDRDAAARRGTEVHKLAHRLILGEDVTPPDELRGHVDAYISFLDQWEPQELLVETTVASKRWNYAGTLDVVADLADGQRWLYDLKTTRSGVYPENALQLAAYRHAEWLLAGDGTAVPMLPVDQAGVVWLRDSGDYELIPCDTGPAIQRTFLYALQIAQYLKEGDAIGAPIADVPHPHAA
jgi:hypothetical protein